MQDAGPVEVEVQGAAGGALGEAAEGRWVGTHWQGLVGGLSRLFCSLPPGARSERPVV